MYEFFYLISGSILEKKWISDIGMMSGPSDSTLFSEILISCSHDVPIGDSYYDPSLAGCWLWVRPLGDKAKGADAVLLISGNIPWDFNNLCAP